MNISGVGSPLPGISSGRFFNSSFPVAAAAASSSSRVPASQRLLQLNHAHHCDDPKKKKRLVPNRKREEAVALQNLSRLIALAPPAKMSRGELIAKHFRRKANYDRLDIENVPPVMRRLTMKKRKNPLCDEDSACPQQDLVYDQFILDALFWHNVYRRQHQVQPLKISPQLCEKAQAWANHLAHTNTFSYDTDKSVGQNIFCRLNIGKPQIDVTAEEAVSYWYSTYKNYAYFKNSDVLHVNINAGSFTQLIWKNTEYFGIGRAVSRYGKLSVVANYLPAGNICGLFQRNVSPSTADKT